MFATTPISDQGGKVEAALGSGALPAGERMVRLVIRDWGPPFNPFAAQALDLSLDVEHRPVGGLGIHFMTTMTDERSYERQGKMNVLTFAFRLDEEPSAEPGMA